MAPKAPRVIFKIQRIEEGDWQVQAHLPGAEIEYVTGLNDKADADDWISGTRRIAWLRAKGFAK
jgi:hypothetical protein